MNKRKANKCQRQFKSNKSYRNQACNKSSNSKKKIKAKKYKKGCFFHELKKFIKTCLARVTAMCKYFKHLPFPNSRRRAKTLNKKVFGKKEASSTDDNQKELGDNVNYR